MTMKVTVVDYDIGNLYSVLRALESVGAQVTLSNDGAFIAQSDRVVLPGVGAFADCIQSLRQRGLDQVVKRYAETGRPLLGICVGMQMLVTESEEFGIHQGLNLIPGRVVAVPRHALDGEPMKVPSIGWAPIVAGHPSAQTGSWLQGHPPDAAVYLVHSFHVQPRAPEHLLATYDFGGHAVTAAIRTGHITGFQFHPEKSGQVGLGILRKFVAAS